jgi:hypothetical protein
MLAKVLIFLGLAVILTAAEKRRQFCTNAVWCPQELP